MKQTFVHWFKTSLLPLKAGTKKPLTSFNDVIHIDEQHIHKDLALRLESPFIVIDIDDKRSADAFARIMTYLNIKTFAVKTDRGAHYYFKSTQSFSSKHYSIRAGLVVEYKCWNNNKTTAVTIKRNSEWREFICKEEPIDLPSVFLPSHANMKNISDAGDGNRHGTLMEIIPGLIKDKLDSNVIYNILKLINECVFETPIDDKEVQGMVIYNPALEKAEAPKKEKKRMIAPHTLAKIVAENMNVKACEDLIYFKDDLGDWHSSKRLLARKATTLIKDKLPDVLPPNKFQLTEMYEFLLNSVEYVNISDLIKENWMLIKFRNCVYNIEEDVLKQRLHAPFMLNAFDFDFEKEIADDQHPLLDGFMSAICCDDKNLEEMLYEMIGYSMLGSLKFNKAFALIGKGANGKSTFIDFMVYIFGFNNCSVQTLEKLGADFATVELKGKLANFSEELPASLIKNQAEFKRLTSGAPFAVRGIYSGFETFVNYATLINSCNHFPTYSAGSYAILRRWIFIPFNAHFEEETADKNMTAKLCCEEVAEIFIARAMRAAKNLLKRGYVLEAEVSLAAKKEFSQYLNNVEYWLEAQNIEPHSLNKEEVTKTYTSYQMFIWSVGMHPVSRRRFVADLKTAIKGIDTTQTTIRGSKMRVFKYDNKEEKDEEK